MKQQETQLFVDIDRIFIILWVLLEWRGISLQITEGKVEESMNHSKYLVFH